LRSQKQQHIDGYQIKNDRAGVNRPIVGIKHALKVAD